MTVLLQASRVGATGRVSLALVFLKTPAAQHVSHELRCLEDRKVAKMIPLASGIAFATAVSQRSGHRLALRRWFYYATASDADIAVVQMSNDVATRPKLSDALKGVNTEIRQQHAEAEDGDHTVFLSRVHGTVRWPAGALCRCVDDPVPWQAQRSAGRFWRWGRSRLACDPSRHAIGSRLKQAMHPPKRWASRTVSYTELPHDVKGSIVGLSRSVTRRSLVDWMKVL